ncbi:DNA-directed RNA polymerase subunit RPC12/RpoP [Paraburkholderia sp. Cpub6]|nr:DNA-directed RNA polymerase subunit RPC12/RpoP [Paraburkholderia sp. Cpub6]
MNDSDTYWQLSEHCCRACFGRVLVADSPDGRSRYRCAQCGARGEGRDASIICCCGIRLKTGADAGVRCMLNDAPSPEWTSEVVAGQV